MDKLIIHGGKKLSGEIPVSGAKNSALPVLASGLLADGTSRFRNIPDLADIRSMMGLLSELGANVKMGPDGTVEMKVVDESNSYASYDRVRKMRASICVLAPLLAKRRYARVSMPGGCAIGTRPVDLHLQGLEALGARISLDNGDIVVKANRLKGNKIFMGGPFGSTVLGTITVICAASLAEGMTLIESAACEPEVVDLANCINSMGGHVAGAGTPRITVEGVESLSTCEHTVIPDRIETGTFVVAGALAGDRLKICGCRPEHLIALLDKLDRAGVNIRTGEETIEISSKKHPAAVDVTTQPYPGFPTDLQAQLMVFLAVAAGNSTVTEKIFPDRFMHVPELNRMGAKIRKEGQTSIITGVKRLVGAPVMASDLRASAALVLAGIVAEGITEVLRVYHIDRGYERIAEKLNAVGAEIERAVE